MSELENLREEMRSKDEELAQLRLAVQMGIIAGGPSVARSTSQPLPDVPDLPTSGQSSPGVASCHTRNEYTPSEYPSMDYVSTPCPVASPTPKPAADLPREPDRMPRKKV